MDFALKKVGLPERVRLCVFTECKQLAVPTPQAKLLRHTQVL